MCKIFRPASLLALLLAAGPLAGCVGVGVAAGVEAASVTVFGRGVVDMGVSAVTGKDCSIVRLDREQPYCAAREQLPDPMPYCTRSLGNVECWADPQAFAVLPAPLGDYPPLTPEQVSQITSRWPKSLNLLGP